MKTIKPILIKILDDLPYIKGLKRDLLNYEKWGQPGHFYNPIPDLDESELYEYAENPSQNLYAGLNLNAENQKKFVESCIELYALKLFLMYNNNFEIIAFNNFLIENDEKWFAENMPLCLKNRGGSIWIRKH